MARTLDFAKRDTLRREAGRYLMERGLTAFSLRPLAEELGTSARMLIHHFGTREHLLREAIESIRETERAELDAYRRRHKLSHAGVATTLAWHWKRLTSPPMRARLPQLFELYVGALGDAQVVASWLFEAPLLYWRNVLADNGVTARRRQATYATLILGTLRGLLLDLAAGGKKSRVDDALRLFADELAGKLDR